MGLPDSLSLTDPNEVGGTTVDNIQFTAGGSAEVQLGPLRHAAIECCTQEPPNQPNSLAPCRISYSIVHTKHFVNHVAQGTLCWLECQARVVSNEGLSRQSEV